MAASNATQFEKDIEEAINTAEDRLGELGNGYEWTVGHVMHELVPVLQKHVPGFDIDRVFEKPL